MWTHRVRMIWSLITIFAFSAMISVASWVAASHETDHVRDTFCAWTTAQIAIRKTFSDRAENARLIATDRQLLRQLDCS